MSKELIEDLEALRGKYKTLEAAAKTKANTFPMYSDEYAVNMRMANERLLFINYLTIIMDKHRESPDD